MADTPGGYGPYAPSPSDKAGSPKLLPCPFCGEQPRLKVWPIERFPLRGHVEISCENAYCTMMNVIAEDTSVEMATDNWNRRSDAHSAGGTSCADIIGCRQGQPCLQVREAIDQAVRVLAGFYGTGPHSLDHKIYREQLERIATLAGSTHSASGDRADG